MRLFVAVAVPQEIREKLASLGEEIRQDGIVPVRPENMHATLKFIGEADEKKTKQIQEELKNIRFGSIQCDVKGIGVFPSENYIRVVWAGIESSGKLEALAKQIQETVKEGDARFSAHLTIARVKRKADLREFLEKHRNDEFGSFTADRFELIKSELGPGGPAYTVLASYEANV